MKRSFRLLTFLTLVFLSFGFNAMHNSPAAAGQQPIDPACVELCRQELFNCLSVAQTNGEERRCISVYRSCVAHCK